MTPYQTILVVP